MTTNGTTPAQQCIHWIGQFNSKIIVENTDIHSQTLCVLQKDNNPEYENRFF